MLRFDVPAVWSNVIRVEAFITFALSALALYTATPWLMLPLLAQALVRGFIGHHRCPSHGVWKALLQKLGKAGKKENAGAKMFANKLLFIASSASLLLAAAGQWQWQIPATVLVVFATLEWALSFCAACWAYTLWYRFFPASH